MAKLQALICSIKRISQQLRDTLEVHFHNRYGAPAALVL